METFAPLQSANYQDPDILVILAKVLLLDHIFQVRKLVHGAGVSSEPLLKEAAGVPPLIELEEIHSTPLVWGPTGELVDNFSDELVVLSAGTKLLDSSLCA